MRKRPLWFWGVLLLAGAAALAAVRLAGVWPPAGAAAVFDQVVVPLGFAAVGLGLIVFHFVRRRGRWED